MGDKTGIEWTDATWNPVVGCSVISPGCTNCYAMKMAARLEAMGQPIYRGMTQKAKAGAVWTGKIEASNWGQVIKPLSWKRPRQIFVNSMSDLFHESLPDGTIDTVFAVMALAPQHTFQVLTKRPERMRDYCSTIQKRGRWLAMEEVALQLGREPRGADNDGFDWLSHKQFLPNVWLGVSVEDQTRADERIPLLLDTPAAKRFLSCEPLLGPVDLRNVSYSGPIFLDGLVGYADETTSPASHRKIDWVIVGGESGPGARPMHPDWARSLRDQCQAAGVPFFFKQWGEWAPNIGAVDGWTIDDNPEISRFDHLEWEDGKWSEPFRPMWCDFQDGNYDEEQCVSRLGKKRSGRLLDGRTWDEVPA